MVLSWAAPLSNRKVLGNGAFLYLFALLDALLDQLFGL